MAYLRAPNGLKIRGTADSILCTAMTVDDAWSGDPKTGELQCDFDGETKMWWDSQETKRGRPRVVNGKRIRPMMVEDTDGNEWAIHQCTLVDKDPEAS
jgi:hypothetical protein